ncbi:MAG TPA: outer membrane beta-barrel protein [Vicinamibacterales bacterium]|nr:outer membrane beta-barrel protein [Vicinamibacterales bacterium]
MRISRILPSMMLCSGLAVAAASAQERGDVGITMGFPASIGVLWHATDTVAIRPDLSFSGSSTDPGDSSSWTLGTGVSALIYMGEAENVRTYFSPRLTYQRSSFSVETAIGGDTTRTANAWGVSGSFGAQYTPNRRFGVFGEVGFSYSRLKTDTVAFSTEGTAHGWGTRAGIGVVFYPGS